MPYPGTEDVEASVRELESGFGASEPAGLPAPTGSNLSVVHRGLATIRRDDLAPGPILCEWGSGFGGACAVAALNGFQPVGIEIRGDLVRASRRLAERLALPLRFAEGSFLQPGDEDLVPPASRHAPRFESTAWDSLGLAPGDCDVVFVYPWPGEESFIDAIFLRHAAPGAVLLTFHGWSYLLAQRKIGPDTPLEPIAWL